MAGKTIISACVLTVVLLVSVRDKFFENLH